MALHRAQKRPGSPMEGGTYATPDGFQGGSKAKETARRLFHKNPNAYFYRHTAPGVPRKFDSSEPWTKKKRNFHQHCRKFGAGDNGGCSLATFLIESGTNVLQL